MIQGVRYSSLHLIFFEEWIINTAGQLIESIEEMPSEDDFQIWLETGRYANGLYVLDVQAGNLHASQKVAFF